MALLEQAEPDAYDGAYKKWRLEHAPITQDVWKLVPKKQTRDQAAKICFIDTGLLCTAYFSTIHLSKFNPRFIKELFYAK